MSKKIMILCSSPRKDGNTNTVAAWVAQAATEAGAQVETVDVAHLNHKVNGCVACMGCQKSEEYECVVKDDAQPILARIPDFDTLVFATPIYFAGMNAQLKLIADRMFSLVKFNMETGEIRHKRPGQSLALIATAGGGMDDSGLRFTDDTCKGVAEFQDAQYASLLVPSAPFETGKMAENAEIKTKAISFGKQLAAL